MQNNIGIIHISDTHLSEENKEKVKLVFETVSEDIKALSEKHSFVPKLVCFSGDLIGAGNSKNPLWDDALKMISDFSESIGITTENFFLTHGNHEVDLNLIDKTYEQGIQSILNKAYTVENVDDFISKERKERLLERTSYFNDIIDSINTSSFAQTDFAKLYETNVEGIKIGIACLNSAWRSSGDGDEEQGRIVIGKRNVDEAFDKIKKCDIKICVVHHPLNWIKNAEHNGVYNSLCNFTMVLNGHVHENDVHGLTNHTGTTLYNTAGRMYPSMDTFNGYSIIVINPQTFMCKIINQEYDYKKNVFNNKECVEYPLKSSDEIKVLINNIIINMRDNLEEYFASFLIPNVIEGKNSKTLKQASYEPELSNVSEYQRNAKKSDESLNSQEIENYTLEELVVEQENVRLIGKKESGKTTVFHRIMQIYMDDFLKLEKVPIYIDCKRISKKINFVEALSYIFICENLSENFSVSKNDVKKLIEDGKCAFLFDNFDSLSGKQKEQLLNFIVNNDKCKYFYGVEEKYVDEVSLIEDNLMPNTYKNVFLQNMNKKQIRQYTYNNFADGMEVKNDLVDTLFKCLENTNLPRTPFVVSVLLSIYQINPKFNALNESTVIEQFMEMLLEKMSRQNLRMSHFDFKNKEVFLATLAWYMDEGDRYSLSYDEFVEFTTNYHKTKGFEMSQSNFLELFFDKNILIHSYEQVFFRYECLHEYYIAKYLIQNPEELEQIIQRGAYHNYIEVIKYYSGLNREDSQLVEVICGYTEDFINNNLDCLTYLNNYGIDIEIEKKVEDIVRNTRENKLSQEQVDDATDRQRRDDYNPIEKRRKISIELNDYMGSVFVLGTVIKNSEELNSELKNKAITIYKKGMCIILSLFRQSFEEFLEEDIKGQLEDKGDAFDELEIAEKLGKVNESSKLLMPVVIQELACLNIGTRKLLPVFEGIIDIGEEPEIWYEAFLLTMLCVDLKSRNSLALIKKYVKNTNNKLYKGILKKDIFKILLMKMQYNYMLNRFTPSEEEEIQSVIADVAVGAGAIGIQDKGEFIQKQKSNKRLPPS